MAESSEKCTYGGCSRPVHAGTDKCIFHAPADKKNPQEFRNALAAQIRKWRNMKASLWSFRGWVFVDVDRQPQEPLPWENYNLFRRAVFPVPADFTEARFETPACFVSSQFMDDAEFDSAQFAEDADFGSAHFTEVDFNSAEFTREADFGSAQFTGGAGFISAQFTGDATFSSAKFTGEVYFTSVQFTRYASFESAQFREDTDFWSAQFSWYADFESARFTGMVNFQSAQFTGDATFESAQFTGDAFFESAQFARVADFGSAEFHKDLGFEYVSFGILGDFSECKIRGHVRLLWPGEGKSRIRPTKGEEDRSLTASAEIQRGKLLLKHLQIEPPGILDLRRNSLAPDCELAIEDCDMERILLEGTDCTKIRFYNCEWTVALDRAMVGDEWLARPYLKRNLLKRVGLVLRICHRRRLGLLRQLARAHVDWSLVVLTYQQLARRFREDFNHSVANDFDRGVFEMKRLMNRRFLARWFGLAAWYRYLSNYGASLIRPLAILAASVIVFAWLYRGTTYPDIHENGAWTSRDYLGLSLQVTYLNRAGLEFARGNSIGVNIFMALQVVLTATLVALFIFAVRRRFRHG
jgi:uncharacterized protein YjbI with pentapeptide repeats